MKNPNVVMVLSDQWRAQASGYAGDPNVKTPNLDQLARESINFTNALSACPVCCPARASLLTGQHPLTHGVFVNDVPLSTNATSLAQAFSNEEYDTAYIGKWHLDGRGRSAFIPKEHRQGFEYWKALECSHDYNHSAYYAGDSNEKQYWDGYDARAQTRDAQTYIREHHGDNPFLMILSWGPPHDPYDTAPEEYRSLYTPENITLRPNTPDTTATREKLAGYYAHCSALDHCLGELMNTLEEEGVAENTILLFVSDHGDMIGSHGHEKKQRPWDEAIRIPFLLRYPAEFGLTGRKDTALICLHDIMPTLLGLCNIAIPDTVETLDYSEYIRGGETPSDGSVVLTCPHAFGEFQQNLGGREYRGLRTDRYTYVRSMNGPWLFYDNKTDPYQQNNLVDHPDYRIIQETLDNCLQNKLARAEDWFLSGKEYMRQWGYLMDETGTVPYTE